MPLELTESQRLALQTRLIVQKPPPGMTLDIVRINGLPSDVLFALEALRLLAEQGNQVAAYMYDDERKKLGIATPTRSWA